MPQTLTMRVGETHLIDVAAVVDRRHVGDARTVSSSDPTKVSWDPVDDFRFRLTALAVGSSVITASVGAVNDTLTVTVIAATAVTAVSILLVGGH